MTTPDPDRNAAIWFADDGYNPDLKGINGRRVAGQSYLRGFFDHADVDEFVSMTTGPKQAQNFAKLVADHPRDIPHRAIHQFGADKMAPIGTLYYPAPNFSAQLWIRQYFGANRYSLCGITHTTATKAVMQGIHNMRTAPHMEWDAVICTSRAVHAATLRNIEIADEALRHRFGSLPPTPQMPVIPLGIDTAQYAHDTAAAARLRKRHKWGKKDIVVATLSRLRPYGKFDPAPLYLALQRAQEALGKTKRLHFIACGIYGEDHSRMVFERGAAALMPDVSFTHMDGADEAARRETLSGADMFVFPIDNVQETFGLAPIEAMAAGLPVITSDWDGMRDTVTEDVGFLVPTRTVQAMATLPEARGYLTDAFTYAQYTARLSAMTAIDIPRLAETVEALARNDDLRRKMGRAGLMRAQSIYDWSKIIPQMQDLWAELAAIRHATTYSHVPANPVVPLPMDLFAAYPSDPSPTEEEVFCATPTQLTLKTLYTARRFDNIGHVFEKQDTVARVLGLVKEAGEAGLTIAAIASEARINPLTVERCMLFLLKFGFVESR